MTRVLSALLLVPVVLAVVWLLPPAGTLVLASIAAALCVLEFSRLSAALGAPIPVLLSTAGALAACVVIGLQLPATEVVLAGVLLAIGVLAVVRDAPGPSALARLASSVFPVVYIGVPLGTIAAIRGLGGREAVLLLMATIVVSDSAQYYTGRALGRTPLSPSISPKKTREGAVGGVVFGTAVMVLAGRAVFPGAAPVLLVVVGLAVVLLGIAGDLFESLLKRSAGLKDSSNLIPGHGGILDRIDSWLFAGPAYYVFVRYFQG